MCVFQTGRNGSDVFSCFQPKQVKTVPTVSTCYACKAGCWNGFKRVLTCCGLKHCWSCCWDFALSSSWLSCGTIKTRGKLSLEKKYGWCQKFFFSVFFLNTMFFSSKKGFGVVSRMSKPRFKKNTFTGQLGLEMEWITKLKSSPGLASSVETSNVETHSTTLFSLEKRWVFARQQWNYCITQLNLQDSSHQPIFPKCTVEIMFHETYQTYG